MAENEKKASSRRTLDISDVRGDPSKDLKIKAFGGLLFMLLVMAALLFLTARTLAYWQAWVFLGVFGASALAITLYLMRKDSKTCSRQRVSAGPTAEKATSQKINRRFNRICNDTGFERTRSWFCLDIPTRDRVPGR